MKEDSLFLIMSREVAQSTEWQGEAKSRKIIQNIIKTCQYNPLWVTFKVLY